MTEVFRLQEAYKTVAAPEVQRWQEAIDVLPYRTCIVHVRCVAPGPVGATVRLQQSARADEAWFYAPVFWAGFPVEVVGSVVHIVPNPQRYLRWQCSHAGAQFTIDVVAREV